MEELCSRCQKEKPIQNKKRCIKCTNLKRESQKRYLKNRPETRQRYFKVLKREVIEKYGGKCSCCQELNIPFLVIDHINNDGNKERKERKNGNGKFYLELKRSAIRNDLQVLCWNCNMGKQHYGVCPHKLNSEEVKNMHYTLPKTEKYKQKYGRKIDWPSNDELINMINKSSYAQVANYLNIHRTTIRARLACRGLLHLIILR